MNSPIENGQTNLARQSSATPAPSRRGWTWPSEVSAPATPSWWRAALTWNISSLVLSNGRCTGEVWASHIFTMNEKRKCGDWNPFMMRKKNLPSWLLTIQIQMHFTLLEGKYLNPSFFLFYSKYSGRDGRLILEFVKRKEMFDTKWLLPVVLVAKISHVMMELVSGSIRYHPPSFMYKIGSSFILEM